MPRDEFHFDVWDAVFLAEGVDLRDVRVVEFGGVLRFGAQAFERGGVVGEGALEHFDRDVTAEGGVLREVDRAHAAGAEAFAQHVFAESGRHGDVGAASRTFDVAEGGQLARVQRRFALRANGFLRGCERRARLCGSRIR